LDKAPDAFRTISEVADDLDIPQHVLRFWETRFTQIKPMKRSGGRRYYRPDDVDLLRGDLVAEMQHLIFIGHIGDMRRDPQALRQGFGLAQPPRLGHVGCRNVAHRDIAAFGDKLPRQFAAHAGAAAGDDRDSASKIFHEAATLSGSTT
jgi:hypothetical protein